MHGGLPSAATGAASDEDARTEREIAVLLGSELALRTFNKFFWERKQICRTDELHKFHLESALDVHLGVLQ
jgi:hypothetical protein